MAPFITENGNGQAKKKALLIAVSYRDLHNAFPDDDFQFWLTGSHRDPFRIKKLLIDRYGYDEKDIVILMDDIAHEYDWPTRENMIEAMHNLVKDAQPGDHFVFHFSGHGSQVVCLDKSEEDGFDEVIWPVDVKYDPSKPLHEQMSDFIIDNDLKAFLVDGLPPDARLNVLFDCCHSGTGLDLPFNRSDHSLDELWTSPVQTTAPLSVIHGDDVLEMDHEFESRYDRDRGMSTDTVKPFSRSSTMMTINLRGTESKRNARGLTRSMGMPHRTRGVILSQRAGEEPETTENVTLVAKDLPKDGSNGLAHVISWSACLDEALGLDCESGGLLTIAFAKLLSGPESVRPKTNRDMLSKLTRELFDMGKMAKLCFKPEELPQPKPCLASLRPSEDVLDELFTF